MYAAVTENDEDAERVWLMELDRDVVNATTPRNNIHSLLGRNFARPEADLLSLSEAFSMETVDPNVHLQSNIQHQASPYPYGGYNHDLPQQELVVNEEDDQAATIMLATDMFGATSPPQGILAASGGGLRASREHWDKLGAKTADVYKTDAQLTLEEKRYLLACERGDLGGVRHYLDHVAKNDLSFNINCVDPLGRSALLIAIENENIEMIEVLLEHDVETGDTLLYAINEENVEAVGVLLGYLEKRDAVRFNTASQGVEIPEHSAFTPDITPIILAAHRDNYEIIKLLLDRNASVPHPHDVRCDCKECLQASVDDSLRLSRSRINAYRALSSPSLICLSQRDPIQYAFELSWELRRLSNIENEFKNEYQELSQTCQKFAVDLLDQTRGSKELEIILNHDNASDRLTLRKPAAGGERMELARLKLAIQLRQKRFVAHPNCQQLLASIWYEGLPGFRRRNIVFKVLLILSVSFAFPFLSLSYLIAPKSSVGQFARKPFIKFMCNSASYCCFLFLLILASQRINYDYLFGSGQWASTANVSGFEMEDYADRKERRGPPPTPVEWAILAYVMGLMWVEIKQLYSLGLYEYCHNMWNVLDFITNSLYLATIMLRLIAYTQVEREIADGLGRELGRSLHRKYWHYLDPTLISECIFATANIFSSLKLVHIFTVNPHLGPLQISLGRMVLDILKFFFVYSLVLFAFACGLNQLFWYYATMRAKECHKGRHLQEEDKSRGLSTSQKYQMEELLDSCSQKYRSFSNLFETLQTLFWAIFGLVDLDHFVLKEEHGFTEFVGKTMFGHYGVISIVVLLNMLIAMMSNSYEDIKSQADVEWKFARSKLWIEYFEDGGTLPAPFNIVPSPKSVYYLLKWACERLCRCHMVKFQQTKQRSIRLQKILKAVSDREAQYQFVMRNLVKRYVAHVQRVKQQSDGVSEDDVNEIKQDISAFRFELLEILSKAGFDTGHANIAQRLGGRNKKRTAQAERRLMKGFQLNVEPISETPSLRRLADALHKHERKAAAEAATSKSDASSPVHSSGLDRFRRLSKKVPRLGAAAQKWQEFSAEHIARRKRRPERRMSVGNCPVTSASFDAGRNSLDLGAAEAEKLKRKHRKSPTSLPLFQQLPSAYATLASPLMPRRPGFPGIPGNAVGPSCLSSHDTTKDSPSSSTHRLTVDETLRLVPPRPSTVGAPPPYELQVSPADTWPPPQSEQLHQSVMPGTLATNKKCLRRSKDVGHDSNLDEQDVTL